MTPQVIWPTGLTRHSYAPQNLSSSSYGLAAHKHTFPPEKTSRMLKGTAGWALSLCNSVKHKYNLSWQELIWFKSPLSYIIRGGSKELVIYFYWFSNPCWILSPSPSPFLSSLHQSLGKFNFIFFPPLHLPLNLSCAHLYLSSRRKRAHSYSAGSFLIPVISWYHLQISRFCAAI